MPADADTFTLFPALHTDVEADPSGYGYHIHPKHPLEDDLTTELAAHDARLDYVLDNFGSLDARDLEVMATIQQFC